MDILERTTETAKKLFMKDGVTIPIVITLKKNGSSDIIPLKYKNDKEKENTLKFLTLFFIAEEVEEYCLVHEAWMKSFEKANENKIPVKVAHLPDKKECIMIFYMKRENNQLIQRSKIIEIHRKPVLHLTDFNEIPNMNFEGTFTELLQAKEPTEFQIRESKQIIAEMTESI